MFQVSPKKNPNRQSGAYRIDGLDSFFFLLRRGWFVMVRLMLYMLTRMDKTQKLQSVTFVLGIRFLF
ncbi:hypothetical protein ASG81_05220 [Paenibacillus sp. Soil522]|nr:hypothetical protein ASG81_05220 [Paenibacillus sp. Soil522]